MRILELGDTHFSNRRPKGRTDERYFDVLMDKLDQAFNIFREEKCDVIVQVGDFFNSIHMPDSVKARLIEYLMMRNRKILAIYGQHDIEGHSGTTYQNCPLHVLEAAGVVELLKNKEPWKYQGLRQRVRIWGASFGQPVPTVYQLLPDDFNILVVHQMIGDKALYPGHSPMDPTRFLRKYSQFDLVLCGDYHYRFIEEYDGRYCINTGAMIRKTVSEHDQALKPGVVIFDTVTKEHKTVLLKVRPPEEVFNFEEKVLQTTGDSAALNRFLNNIRETKGKNLGWKDLLLKQFELEATPMGVREMVNDNIIGLEAEENE